MLRRSLRVAVALFLVISPACLFNSKNETIVAPDAARDAVSFENDAAMLRFQDAVRGRYHAEKVESKSEFAIPFLIDVENRRVTSENAYWNAQVAKADVDKNGLITDIESQAYAGVCAAH